MNQEYWPGKKAYYVMGDGYHEPRQSDFANEPGWRNLAMKFPGMAEFDLVRYTFFLHESARKASDLAATVLTFRKTCETGRQFRVDMSVCRE